MIISRLTATAALFAVIATASLSFAASSQGQAPVAAAATPVVQLEPVIIHVTRGSKPTR